MSRVVSKACIKDYLCSVLVKDEDLIIKFYQGILSCIFLSLIFFLGIFWPTGASNNSKEASHMFKDGGLSYFITKQHPCLCISSQAFVL